MPEILVTFLRLGVRLFRQDGGPRMESPERNPHISFGSPRNGSWNGSISARRVTCLTDPCRPPAITNLPTKQGWLIWAPTAGGAHKSSCRPGPGRTHSKSAVCGRGATAMPAVRARELTQNIPWLLDPEEIANQLPASYRALNYFKERMGTKTGNFSSNGC